MKKLMTIFLFIGRPEKNGSGRFSGLLAELIFACAVAD